MGRDFTDDIDDCCEAMLGHTNWGFMDTELDKDVTHKLRKDPKIKYVVVFYKASDICPKCDVHEIDCECEEEDTDE